MPPGDVVHEMAERLRALEAGSDEDAMEVSFTDATTALRSEDTPIQVAPGWKLLDDRVWQLCPIGIFNVKQISS